MKNRFWIFALGLPLLCGACSTLNQYAQSVFTPANIATTAIQQATASHEAPDDFSFAPIQDEKIQAYAQGIGQKLFAFSTTQGLSIIILNTARVQGLSVYNTKTIDITRGMLNMMRTEAELACLIGHEIGHADLGHWSKVYEEGTGQKILNVGAAMSGSGVVSALSDAQRKIAASGWEQDKEQAADEYGAVLAAKAGYDPFALCELFDRLLQKVDANALYHAGSLVATHKTLDARAAHLREYLKDHGYKPGKGIRNVDVFEASMAGLNLIRTHEGVETESEFDKIMDEFTPYTTTGKSMNAAQFVRLMNRLSDLYQKQKGSASGIGSVGDKPAHDNPQFMSEPIYQDSPFSGGYLPKDYEKRIKDALVHLVVGGVPVVGNVAGFAEGLTGKNFYTREDLSANDRKMSLIGGVAVQTGQNETLDYAAGAVGNITTVKSYGDSLASIAKDLGADIDQSVNDSIQSAGGILDKGKNWSRVDDGTAPPWKGVYRMETTSDQTFYQVTTKDGVVLLDHSPSGMDQVGDIKDVRQVKVYSGEILRVFQKFGVITYKE